MFTFFFLAVSPCYLDQDSCFQKGNSRIGM